MGEKVLKEITRNEIIEYVDKLIKENRDTYDKRLDMLIYEFFLRATEKFHWDRITFLTKFTNFSKNVKIIQPIKREYIVRLEESQKKKFWGIARRDKKAIYVNEELVYNGKIPIEIAINTFFHEFLHQTDYETQGENVVKDGLYTIFATTNAYVVAETMLNEIVNEVATYMITTDKSMKETNMPFLINTMGYEPLSPALSIMCASYDISEIELAVLKDKGRVELERYLEKKYPYIDNTFILSVYAVGINNIWNTYLNFTENKSKKEDLEIAYQNVIDNAINIIRERIHHSFLEESYSEELVERMYFDREKIVRLMNYVKSIFKMNKGTFKAEYEKMDEVLEELRAYRKFSFSKYEEEDIKKIHRQIEQGIIDTEFIESNVGEEYESKSYVLKEIINKYYAPSAEPLNDNSKLIEQLTKHFRESNITEEFRSGIKVELSSIQTNEKEIVAEQGDIVIEGEEK